MKEHIRWYILLLLLKLSYCQEKWVHICQRGTKEVSCEKRAILEVTGVYNAYRELGCPDGLTDPVSVIANCSQKTGGLIEDVIKTEFATRCNQTIACNITTFALASQFVCSQPKGSINVFRSYSYICKPGPSTAAPLTNLRPVTQSLDPVSKPTDPPVQCVQCPTDNLPDNSSGYIAAAAIGGMLIGLVLGTIGTLCLSVHRGISDSIVNCITCKSGRKEKSSQNNDLRRNTTQEERIDYYNVNSTGQSHNAVPNSGLSMSDLNQVGNYEDIPEDINLEDVKVYSELQSNDYVNGPDSTIYEGLKSQRS